MLWFAWWAACELPECPSDLQRTDPPIYGGGIEMLSDGVTAVAIDVETSRAVTIDTTLGTHVTETVFDIDSEPFRVADGGDVFYVTLRGSGELAVVSREDGSIVDLIEVCPAPRGVAVDYYGTAHVACAGGELVSISGSSHEIASSLYITPDLRDVVVDDLGEVWVSTFRSAEVIAVGSGERYQMPERTVTDAAGVERVFRPGVAWRMRGRIGGGVDLLYRLAVDAPIERVADQTTAAIACSGDILFGISRVTSLGVVQGPLVDSALAVDFSPNLEGFYVAEFAKWGWPEGGDCVAGGAERLWGHGIATDKLGRPVLLTRNPFRVTVGDTVIDLPSFELQNSVQDAQSLVCTPPGATMSAPNSAFHDLPAQDSPPCAACHPEAGDDGTIWEVVDRGPLRTPSLRGLAGTEPLHWNAEFDNLGELLSKQVPLLVVDPDELLSWLDGMTPDPATSPDPDLAAKGEQIAEGAGCLGCHGIDGPSAPGSFDVGTGGLFQVPRLRGVSMRLPLMHNGCAQTLEERFEPTCGGSAHGATEDLGDAEIAALVAWLGGL